MEKKQSIASQLSLTESDLLCKDTAIAYRIQNERRGEKEREKERERKQNGRKREREIRVRVCIWRGREG